MSNISWKRLALDRDLDRSSHALATLGSKVYIFGGEKEPRTPIDDLLYIVDLKDGTVATSASKLRPSARVGAALTADKKRNLIYLWGGRQSKEMTPCDASLWVYDVAGDAWTEITADKDVGGDHQVPAERSYHCMTVLGDEVFLHAGCPASGRLSTHHSLTLPVSSPAKCDNLPSAPEPGRGGTALCPLTLPASDASTSNQVLVRYGGFAGHELGSSLDVYDPSQRIWSTLAFPPNSDSTPEARSVHALIPFSFQSTISKAGNIVALMLFGERDPAPVELGHNGAGKFHSDVWALRYTPPLADKDDFKGVDGVAGFSFERVRDERGVQSDTMVTPEPRGWFGADICEDAGGDKQVVVLGGLNGKNQRLGDLWLGELTES
ncbi:hypothetical protein QFC22_001612 [Naganishia vaughanmartiniae]|uniref:Uncharacterized protein n=1 Tax=Naganishia vaughanmartiniae TaxID=1424756 RepID=A0ACC2XIJ6_9TREE|nr:hypothetical protein QFC22_001612 [Naganishia vaughanmartiniae]